MRVVTEDEEALFTNKPALKLNAYSLNAHVPFKFQADPLRRALTKQVARVCIHETISGNVPRGPLGGAILGSLT
jgi:hypothetical protein